VRQRQRRTRSSERSREDGRRAARPVPRVTPGGEESPRDACPAPALVCWPGCLARLWSCRGRARRGRPTTREESRCCDPAAGLRRDHQAPDLGGACRVDSRTRCDGRRRARQRERRRICAAGTVGVVSPERAEGAVGIGECSSFRRSSSRRRRSTRRGVAAHGYRHHGRAVARLYTRGKRGDRSLGQVAAPAGRPAVSGAGPPSDPLSHHPCPPRPGPTLPR
jgi:hypothetical protein